MGVSTISNWGEAIQTSIAAGLAILLAGIPKIIGFLVILLIGWIIASILAKVVQTVLDAVHFDHMADRAGITTFVRDMGMTMGASAVLAMIVKWFVRLIVLVAAFDALGLPVVASLLNRLLLWIPNLIVALVILVIAGIVANALGRLVRGATAEAGIGNPGMFEMLTKVAVWGFAILVAVSQIGVAGSLINILFMGFVGALALAFGLSFGLGGQTTAGQIVQSWYQQSQQAAAVAQVAAQKAQQQMGNTTNAAATPAQPDGLTVEQRPRS